MNGEDGQEQAPYHYVKLTDGPVIARSSDGRGSRAKAIFILILALCAVVGIVASILLYNQHRKDQKTIRASGVTSRAEAEVLVDKVAHLMQLPRETPTVATVSDYRKLPRQTFFQNARNGDKVLIYAKAKTAILYDPGKNLILAVAPLTNRAASGTR